MSSDVTITCDGQWPKKPMYSSRCHESISRDGGALWPTYEYAWERASQIHGWKRHGDRDVCPACHAMIEEHAATDKRRADALAQHR